MEKADNVFTCRCKDSRGRPFEPFSFAKDEDDNIVATLAAVQEKRITAKDIIFAAMEPGTIYTSNELSSYVENGNTGRTAIQALKSEGRIEKVDGGYRKRLDDG